MIRSRSETSGGSPLRRDLSKVLGEDILAAADQLQQPIGAQRIGIVLILGATGEPEDPLPNQGLERVADLWGGVV